MLWIADHQEWLIARPRTAGVFDPLAADPLSGDWLLSPAPAGWVTTAFDPVVLIRPESCAICQTVTGDYDRNGVLNTKDRLVWSQQYGYVGDAALADGNGDGVVNAADYTVWRDAFESVGAASVPEPAGLAAVFTGLVAVAAASQRSR